MKIALKKDKKRRSQKWIFFCMPHLLVATAKDGTLDFDIYLASMKSNKANRIKYGKCIANAKRIAFSGRHLAISANCIDYKIGFN